MTRNAAALRQRVRRERRELSPNQQKQASVEVCAHLLLLPEIATLFTRVNAPVVAATIAHDGELDPAPCVKALRTMGAQVAFPLIGSGSDGQELSFRLIEDAKQLAVGAFGILEPVPSTTEVPATALHLVLTPLVAFDAGCNRMGRGKGFYDRAFQFLQGQQRPTEPVLIGLAHELQRVDALESDSHDVQLDLAVTPAGPHRS